MNQPEIKRLGLIIVLSNVFNAMAIDIYLPSLPSIQQYFSTTEYKTQLIIVVFYFGAVLSRLFWGPFSDIIGRRKAILMAYTIQTFFQLLCIFSPSVEHLIVFRALQSLGSGVTSVIGTAIIADYYTGNERARILNLIELSFIIAFIFAPAIGVLLNGIFGWKGGFIFIFLSFIFSFSLFFYFLPLDEKNIKFHFKAVLEILNIYKKSFNLKIVRFSFISGTSAGLFMGFAMRAPFMYFSKFSVSQYEYIFFQMSPFIINFIITINYKRILNWTSTQKTISFCLYALIFLSVMILSISKQILYENKYTYLFIMCYISTVTPFLITGGITLTLKDVVSKGAASSIIASIRSFCLFSTMYITSMISSDHVFYFIPVITFFLILLWFSNKSTI